MDVWVQRCDSHEEAERADREFWSQMSGEERVGALEEMRMDEKVDGGENDGRLRRTVRVFQRS